MTLFAWNLYLFPIGFPILLLTHLTTQTIKVNPTWSKGYARKGAALHGAHNWDEAIAAYEAGLEVEKDAPALLKGLREVKDARGNDSLSRF